MKKILGLGLVMMLLVVGVASFADETEVATYGNGYGRTETAPHRMEADLTDAERAELTEAKIAYLDKLLLDAKITQEQYDTMKTEFEDCTGDHDHVGTLRTILGAGEGFKGGSTEGRGYGQGHGNRNGNGRGQHGQGTRNAENCLIIEE